MEHHWVKLVGGTDTSTAAATALGAAAQAMIAQSLAKAQNGECDALFDLGVAFSTGSDGVPVDLVEAHKWFNLATVGGHDDAAGARADVAEDMSAREIAEAQRRAREWLRAGPGRKVA